MCWNYAKCLSIPLFALNHHFALSDCFSDPTFCIRRTVGKPCASRNTKDISPCRWSVRSRLLRSGAGPSWGLICKMRVNVLIHSSMSCSLSAASTKYVTSFIFSSKACFLRRLFYRGTDGRMDRLMWLHDKKQSLVSAFGKFDSLIQCTRRPERCCT